MVYVYYEEILRDYPAWLAKKMEPEVNNKLLNKGTKRKRAGDDGSESKYGPAPYTHKQEACVYPPVWGINVGKINGKNKS